MILSFPISHLRLLPLSSNVICFERRRLDDFDHVELAIPVVLGQKSLPIRSFTNAFDDLILFHGPVASKPSQMRRERECPLILT